MVYPPNCETSHLATTLVLSLTTFSYILYYFDQKIKRLEATKKDFDMLETIEPDMYQSWLGSFTDGSTCVLVTIVWKKCNTAKSNVEWLNWDKSEDESVINRNFYLGNTDPSFDWSISENGLSHMKAEVNDMLTDGWNTLIQYKITAFIQESKTNDELNALLKKLILQGQLEWERSLISKQEVADIFA